MTTNVSTGSQFTVQAAGGAGLEKQPRKPVLFSPLSLLFYLSFPLGNLLLRAGAENRHFRCNPQSQLHLQEPEELTPVEQYPMTTGGAADLMQVACPTAADPNAADPTCGTDVASAGGLFVLS